MTGGSGAVIERVWRDGGTFQEWSERFELARWLDAMAAEGLDPDWYVTRHRSADEILPWDHIAAGLHRDFLWQDWQEALAEHGLPDCRWTPVLRLWRVHRLRPRTRRRVAGRARRREPGHGTGPRLGRRTYRCGCCRRRSGSRPDARRHRLPGPDPLHEARQGAVHRAPRRRPRASNVRFASSSSHSRSRWDSRPARR